MLMTWKTAIAGIPYGGAKGGIDCPGDQLAPEELQKITRSFMDKIHKVLGPNRDIMAPDVNTSAQVMAWLMDEYGKLSGHTPAIVTGKPIALEGSYGRESATGRGLVYMFREAAPQASGSRPPRHLRGPGLRQRRFVGSPHPPAAGRPRSSACRTRTERSARLPGSTRRSSPSSSPKGGKITEFEGVEPIIADGAHRRSRATFCLPAALGGMIHEGNADTINCRMLLEGANSPTTPGADEVLEDKGVLVIPDVMANAGGVVVSYFEWVQNMQHFRWEEREINDKLGNIMRRAFREVDAVAKETRISSATRPTRSASGACSKARSCAATSKLLTDAAARYRRDSARGCRRRHPIASA